MKKQLQETISRISEIEEINLIIYNQDKEKKDEVNFTIICSELNILDINYEKLLTSLDFLKTILINKNIKCSFTIITEKELMKQEKSLEEQKKFYNQLADCTIVYSNSTKLQNLIYTRKNIKNNQGR